MKRWSHLHGDMQGEHEQGRVLHTGDSCPQLRLERNSLSGKETCPAVPQGMAEYRLISGKPYLPQAAGNPEGSRGAARSLDPVTTDPKGEACRPG
jgi:hypothetical protein